MEKSFLLALDQGTTSSRAILFDPDGNIRGSAQQEFAQHYPQPGWVEHDPMEIWETQRNVIVRVMRDTGVRPAGVAALGIANQRETTIVWDRDSGKPVCNAIVWQDRRTAPLCEALRAQGLEPLIRANTGLMPDAYFSGTKVKWILDNVPGARARAEQGRLLFGTVDTWLLWKLTDGRVHATDPTNASRTLLYNIRDHRWEPRLLEALGVPESMLPRVRPSAGDFGAFDLDGVSIPIRGVAGDQQAALFGQACLTAGSAKCTYGTGCFLLMNTGARFVESRHGLLTTLACGPDGQPVYALEGSVFTGGAAIQWLRDGLHIIGSAAETQGMAEQAGENDGVVVVPAFTGLGAPHWDMYARGAVFGLTRGVTREQLVRATLQSLAHQTRDVLHAMRNDTGLSLPALRVDGGAAANDYLMQFQSDLLDTPVERPVVLESTALGAAALAGLGSGVWDEARFRAGHRLQHVFRPAMDGIKREALTAGWNRAVASVRQFALSGS